MKSAGIIVGVLFAAIVLFFLGAAAISGTEAEVTATVKDKERINDCSGETCESYYLVFTDEGTFKNSDSLVYGKFNSSDIQGMLEPGQTYTFMTVGFRVPFMSMYPNIIEVTPVRAAARPVLHSIPAVPTDTWELIAFRKDRIEGPTEEPVEITKQAVHIERSVWDAIADCESNSTWDIDTGNGYRGGLQWNTNTWLAVRPADAPDNPALASRAQEIQAAQNLMAEPWGGYHHWPVCSRVVGVR